MVQSANGCLNSCFSTIFIEYQVWVVHSASFELNLVNSQWPQMKNTKEKELQEKGKANLFEINWKYPWFIVDSSNSIFHLDLVHVKKHLKWTNQYMFDLG